MMSHWMRLVLLGAVLMLQGCAVANSVADPETVLRIHAAINTNPNDSGRPSPLVLRIYELSARNAFESSDFFNLYDSPEQTLGNDLVSVEDLVVRPGENYTHPMSLNRKTRFIGVVAAFRDIQDAQWALVAEADPQGYDKIRMRIDRLSLERVKDD